MAAVLEPALEIRTMRRADLTPVAAIEAASYPYPWPRGIFADCLRVGYRCFVLCDSGTVTGYGIVSMAIDEAHLLNLCIAPDRRRSGLAGALLGHLIDEVRVAGMDRIFLEVRPTNRGAVALYRGHDFRVIGRRPGYYPAADGREDAAIMVRHLDPAAP